MTMLSCYFMKFNTLNRNKQKHRIHTNPWLIISQRKLDALCTSETMARIKTYKSVRYPKMPRDQWVHVHVTNTYTKHINHAKYVIPKKHFTTEY